MVHLTTALEPGSGVPLYEQLYRSLAGEMRTGALPAGTRMPGKRRLAAELSVSVNTVDTAYQMLAAEGYLAARERSGFYVQEYLALPQVGPDARGPSPAPAVPEPAAPEPPVRYDLSTRGVDPRLFPFRTWARLQKELLYSSPELLTNGDAQGDLALRQALADYLAEYRGVQCGAHQVVVGAGLEYLPEHLLPAWHAKYRLYSGTVSRFEQQTLARFITGGYFTRHLARERVAYKARRDALTAALNAAFAPGELTLTGLHTGLHLLAHLRNAPPDAALHAAARAQGVRLSLLSDYDLTGSGSTAPGTFVLGYGSLADDACPSVGETLKKLCTAARDSSLRV